MRIVIIVMSLALSGWIAGAAADPWKAGSGKNRHRGYDARHNGFELHSGGKSQRDWASIPDTSRVASWQVSSLVLEPAAWLLRLVFMTPSRR